MTASTRRLQALEEAAWEREIWRVARFVVQELGLYESDLEEIVATSKWYKKLLDDYAAKGLGADKALEALAERKGIDPVRLAEEIEEFERRYGSDPRLRPTTAIQSLD